MTDSPDPDDPWRPPGQPSPAQHDDPAAGIPADTPAGLPLGSPPRGPHYLPLPGPPHSGQQGPAAPAATQLASAWRPSRRSGAIIGVALVAALVGGGIGGAVGVQVERDRHPDAGASAPPAPVFTYGNQTPTDNSSGGAQLSVAAIAARVLPSVVTIKVDGPDGSGTGSGVIVTSSGYIVTNNHVVEVAAGSGSVQVVFSNSRTHYTASIVGRDPRTDLAVIRVHARGDLPAAILGRSGALVVGDPVVAIGAPLDLSSTVTSGIVSALNRNITVPGEGGSSNTLVGAIQTDAAINPGNSGGALVDDRGQVIGINTAIATAPNGGSGSIGLGFAIPIDYAKSIVNEIIRTGRATHPYVGVNAQSVAPDGTTAGGALIVTVVPSGPADLAGLQAGDVITQINRQPVDNANDLVAATQLHKIGDQVTVTYLRDGGEHSVSLRLQEAPVN